MVRYHLLALLQESTVPFAVPFAVHFFPVSYCSLFLLLKKDSLILFFGPAVSLSLFPCSLFLLLKKDSLFPVPVSPVGHWTQCAPDATE